MIVNSVTLSLRALSNIESQREETSHPFPWESLSHLVVVIFRKHILIISLIFPSVIFHLPTHSPALNRISLSMPI